MKETESNSFPKKVYTAFLNYVRLMGISICLFLAYAWWSPGCRSERAFYHIEENAKKVTTGSELQTWAANLLIKYPTNASVSISNLGPDFPRQLLQLAPRLGPHITVEKEDTNSPAYVLVYWGSGMLGAKMFEIGPTNFESLRGGTPWGVPGVFFVKRN